VRAAAIAYAVTVALSVPAAAQPLSEADAVALLRRNHIDGAKVGAAATLDAAIAALGDPWTRRYDATHAAAFIAEVTGAAKEGIGLPELLSVDLDRADGRTAIVITPLRGSPAARAGLRPGDRLVAVGGRPAGELGWAQLMDGLRAPTVRLRVARAGRERDVVLRPARLATATVRFARGRLAIDRFTASTPDEVRAALASAPPGPIVVDLRGNGGGDVAACLAVAGLLAGPIEVGRIDGPGTVLRAEGEAPGRKLLAVEVDEGTASAAELLASGLRAAGVAVRGKPTARKCLVHNGAPLEGGGLLLYTSGRIAGICEGGVLTSR
jgi:carboxyl-terminal processing protease